MARMATSKSGKDVEAAMTIAAWTDIQDLIAMLKNRSKPGIEIARVQGPRENDANVGPGAVKMIGSAASTKGKARTARFIT